MESVPPSGVAFASSLPWRKDIGWFACGATLAFAVPFAGTTVLELHHDLYLGFYFAFVGLLLWRYVQARGVDIGPHLRRNTGLSVGLGVLLLALLTAQVLSEGETARPHGAYFVFELVWRGLVYGTVDAVLLSAFPALIAYRLVGGRLSEWRDKATYATVTLALVLLITATYHLGYEQYREDGLAAPELGNTTMSVPVMLTANPLGSIVSHSGMHVVAVTHEYETDTRLPPSVDSP